MKLKNRIDYISKYIINEKATIIIDFNGNKMVVKKDDEDKFDKELGFLLCFYKWLNTQCTGMHLKSKSSLKRILATVKEEKMKDYLFEIFNYTTFNDAEKSRKYLKNLKLDKNFKNLVPEDKPMEETPKKMTEEKMVFSIYKFLKEESEVEEAFEFGWTQECDGKTIKECNKIGYEIEDYWLVPRSQFKPYKEN